MKRNIFLIIILTFSLLGAVEHYNATGRNVSPSVRDTLFYYHNNTDDQYWFGSESWAVKFEFNELFEDIDSLAFEAEGANIFLPGITGSDPITIKLCEDRSGQPLTHQDSLLFTSTLQASEIQYQNWNYIPFSNAITDTTLWLVVDYPTNSTDQFISASVIGGMQSYFLNNGYYNNMFGISYDSEFLFSLNGRLLFEGIDLDLVSIDWEGVFLPGSLIYPKFTIKNNSDISVSDSYISLTLNDPNSSYELLYASDSTSCPQIDLPVLNANEIYTFDFTDSLMFILPDRASQYQFAAELFCEVDSLTFNNSKEDEFQVYTEQLNKVLIENAILLNDSNSNSIWLDQSSILDTSNCITVNYFANFVDEPFFNNDSYARYHYYDLMGFPATIVNGYNKLLGYTTNYSSQLSEFYAEAFSNGTFISSDTCYAFFNEVGDVGFYYEIENSQTQLFNSFINDLSLKIGIIENVLNEPGIPLDITLPVFTYLVAEVEASQFLSSSIISDSVLFNMNDDYTTITNTSDNCEVVFWLQNDETKEIFHVNKLPFTEFQPGLVSLDEDEIPIISQSLNIFPNPCRSNELMNIAFSISNTMQSAELKIYNIKGQLVKTIIQEPDSQNVSFIWNGKNDVNKQVSSGIYLMQINAKVNGKEYKYHKKSLLIR
ncbi:MAG: T9SS type A sorting domain-containing protein [Candidatus Cloacimonetes bacterium]|nr:T9SS type A sorting domain-containing protein [Candidatus Cloacimonadota bacterium]MBT4575482.1 T9SS type A sorting domain-containing protein [Candidatus Cloacimonadota bacterium]